MIPRALCLAAFAAVSGCANTEATLLLGARSVHGHEDHHDIAAELTITQRIGRRGVCSVSHSSNPAKGSPVNDEFDVSHDFAGCGIRWSK